MLFATIKCLHLVALLLLFASSVVKNLLVTPATVQAQQVAWCRIADKVSGAAAGLVVLSGIALLVFSPKSAAFYTGNGLFATKIALLVVASVLIVRTKIFFRAHAATALTMPTIDVAIPTGIRKRLRFDAVSLVAMVCLAVLVVNGIGWRWA